MPRVTRPSAVCLQSLCLDMWRKVRKELSEPLSGSGNHVPSPWVEFVPPRTHQAPRRPRTKAGPGRQRTLLSTGALNPVRRGEAKRKRPAQGSGALKRLQKRVQEVVSWPESMPDIVLEQARGSPLRAYAPRLKMADSNQSGAGSEKCWSAAGFGGDPPKLVGRDSVEP